MTTAAPVVPADLVPADHPADLVPRWFGRVLVVALAGVVGVGGVGLVLALVGWCRPLVVAGVGGPVVVVLARAGWRLDPRPLPRSHSRGGTAWAVAALVLCIGSAAVNSAFAGEHVLVNRDPGVHLVAARWIAAHGTLAVDAGDGPFGASDVVRESAGTYEEGRGQLDLQFNHLVPVLLAEAHWLGGDRAMVVLPAILGALALLTTYALATRLTRRPWAGLLVAVTLATSLPVVAAVRDSYSEPAAWLLLTGGLWLWTRAADERRVGVAALAGLTLGAVATARVDGLLYLLPVPVVLGLLASSGGRGWSRRGALALGLATLPGVLLSAADLLLRSREYDRDLAGEIRGLWLALAVMTAVGIVLQHPSVRHAAGRVLGPAVRTPQRRQLLGLVAATAVVALGLVGWFVRPHVQVARTAGSFPSIGPIQQAEGQPVDLTRRYDERSIQWLSWYVGPAAVGLAIAGGAVVVRRAAAGTVTAAGVAWLSLAGGAVLYLWQPSITPDHIWASRRFVPAVLPLVATLAGVAAVAAVEAVRRRVPGRVAVAGAAGAVLCLAVVGPTVARTRPVAALSDQHGYLDLVGDLCAAVDGGAVLALDGERAGITLPQTIRSFCDVPAAMLAPGDATPARVAALAAAWAAEGRDLHVVAASVDAVRGMAPGAAVVQLGPYAHRALEVTLTRPPSRLIPVSDTMFVATVDRP